MNLIFLAPIIALIAVLLLREFHDMRTLQRWHRDNPQGRTHRHGA